MRLAAAIALAGAVLGCVLIRGRRGAGAPESDAAASPGADVTSAGQPAA
jgi:hypothetical protein